MRNGENLSRIGGCRAYLSAPPPIPTSERVGLGRSRLRLHLEEAAPVAVLGLDLHVLTAPAALQDHTFVVEIQAHATGERLAMVGDFALEDRRTFGPDRKVLVRPGRVSAGVSVVEDREVARAHVERDVGAPHLDVLTHPADADGPVLVSGKGPAPPVVTLNPSQVPPLAADAGEGTEANRAIPDSSSMATQYPTTTGAAGSSWLE